MEAYEGQEPYIFVSYSHNDKNLVMQFIEELQKYCNVWYDFGIHAGNEWADKIAEKISNCSLFLFVVSSNSLSSENCKDELAMARDIGKPFINVRLTDATFESGMQLRYGRYQFFDLFQYNDFSQAVKQLIRSENLGSLCDKKEVLKGIIERTLRMMATTEEMSPNINNNNADFFIKFRTTESTVEFGKYYDDPIIWEIKSVQKDRAVLVSKNILEAMAFDCFNNQYKNSKIRSWLNTEFAEVAFNDEETRLLCPLNSNAEKCETDKVGLLNISQVEQFYRTDKERIKLGTQHAKNAGLMTNSSGIGWWWTSSSDETATGCVYRVYSNGRLGFDDDFDNESIGVVPMIIVKID